MDMTVFMAALQSAFNSAVESAVAAKLAPLQQQCAALETKLAEAELFTRTTTTSVELDPAKMVEALNSQEWFWTKISAYVAAIVPEEKADPDLTLTDLQLQRIASHVDKGVLAARIALSDLAEAIDLSELASEISVSDVADNFSASDIAEEIDIEGAVEEFFHTRRLRVC